MTGYGKQAGLSARGGLLLTGLLVAAVAWMLATGYDAAAARCRTQGTYALRCGPHDSGLALVSDDGMETWRKP
jgi:hypothetical protein